MIIKEKIEEIVEKEEIVDILCNKCEKHIMVSKIMPQPLDIVWPPLAEDEPAQKKKTNPCE